MKINKKHVAILLGLLIGASNAFSASIILTNLQDSTALGADPTGNYGAFTIMRIRWESADDWGRYFPLVKFDLAGLPNNIIVNYARFAFWTEATDDGGPGWPGADDFPLLSMYNNTADWSESTMTYNTRPSTDAFAIDTSDHFDPDDIFTAPDTIAANKTGWLFFDGLGSAALVQSWANGLTNNYGVTISGTGAYTDTARYFDMFSKEHPNFSIGMSPYLYVDYTAIPEPATMILFGIFAVGLLRMRK